MTFWQALTAAAAFCAAYWLAGAALKIWRLERLRRDIIRKARERFHDAA